MLQCDRQQNNALIIGGGLTGLITATVLQREGIKVTVLDKGRGIGGRLATKRMNRGQPNEGIFDYGTQYFSVETSQFRAWVEEWLQQGVIKEWCGGFGETDGKPRYCGVEGTRAIAKYLATDLDVHTSTRVVNLEYSDRWLVETDKQQYEGNILVMTPPVPQSLTLLNASGIVLPPKIESSLKKVSYHSCIAVLALLERPSLIPQPGGIALENEALVWLADNHQKGISPDGYAVTLHATPKFSDAHWDRDNTEIAELLLTAASDYLGSTAIAYQVHRWRYSLPKTFYSQPYLALPESLVIAGDAFVAPNLEGAVLSGIAAGEAVIEKVMSSK